MTTVADILEEAAECGCTIEVRGTRVRWKAPEAPPTDLLLRLRERKFEVFEHLRHVPAEWAAGVARLESMPAPQGWPETHWQRTIDGTLQFFDTWGSQAYALGWQSVELFGAHREAPYHRVDCLGLALSCHREPVTALTADTARFSKTTFYRKPSIGKAVPVWALRD